MKKLMIVAATCASLVAMQARATVSIVYGGANVYADNGATLLAPDNNETVLLLEDTSNSGAAPTATIPNGASLATGSTIAGHYLVLQNKDNTSAATGSVVNMFGPAWLGSGGLVLNAQLDLMWIAGLGDGLNDGNGAQSVPATGIWNYGSYYGGPGLDGSDPWQVPSDGSSIDLVMETSGWGGSNPESAGYAIYQAGTVVPEPSSITLLVLGIASVLGTIRHRR